jgi:hypothetical protein
VGIEIDPALVTQAQAKARVATSTARSTREGRGGPPIIAMIRMRPTGAPPNQISDPSPEKPIFRVGLTDGMWLSGVRFKKYRSRKRDRAGEWFGLHRWPHHRFCGRRDRR